jgi:hypothetical protein
MSDKRQTVLHAEARQTDRETKSLPQYELPAANGCDRIEGKNDLFVASEMIEGQSVCQSGDVFEDGAPNLSVEIDDHSFKSRNHWINRHLVFLVSSNSTEMSKFTHLSSMTETVQHLCPEKFPEQLSFLYYQQNHHQPAFLPLGHSHFLSSKNATKSK